MVVFSLVNRTPYRKPVLSKPRRSRNLLCRAFAVHEIRAEEENIAEGVHGQHMERVRGAYNDDR